VQLWTVCRASERVSDTGRGAPGHVLRGRAAVALPAGCRVGPGADADSQAAASRFGPVRFARRLLRGPARARPERARRSRPPAPRRRSRPPSARPRLKAAVAAANTTSSATNRAGSGHRRRARGTIPTPHTAATSHPKRSPRLRALTAFTEEEADEKSVTPPLRQLLETGAPLCIRADQIPSLRLRRGQRMFDRLRDFLGRDA
jgi:hypothetical protein